MKRVLLVKGVPGRDDATGRDDAGHPFGETGPLIEAILSTGEFELTTEDNVERAKQEHGFTNFDAIVLHGRFPFPADERRHAIAEQFEKFVHRGGGLVVVHIASSSFELTPRWRKLVGRVWEYGGPPPFTSTHPEPGPFRIDIAGTTHPIIRRLQGFELLEDERYEALLVAPNATIHVLATATLEGRTEPVAWVLNPPEGGRVFHLTPGHGPTTYTNDSFTTLLLRGVAWAAGEPL
jgi:uncharacterized protein